MVGGYTAAILWDVASRMLTIVHRILVQLPWSFSTMCLVSSQVVHPYSSMDTTAAWKKLYFILSARSEFHMTDSLSITAHAFATRVWMSFLVDEMLLPRLVKLSTSFREPLFSMEILRLWLKCMYSVLSVLTLRLMPPPDYAAAIWPGQVYLPEALCHQHSPHL